MKAEWPGILVRAIDGAIAWQTQGLNPPKAVSAATESYFEAEDAIGAWFAERCKKDPQHFTTIAELFRSWKSWAERAGEYVGSAKALSQELDNRGFERNRDGKDRSHVSARRSWGGAVVASSSQQKPYTQPHRQHHHRITHPDSTAPP